MELHKHISLIITNMHKWYLIYKWGKTKTISLCNRNNPSIVRNEYNSNAEQIMFKFIRQKITRIFVKMSQSFIHTWICNKATEI